MIENLQKYLDTGGHGSALLTALSRAFDRAYWNSWTLDAGVGTLDAGPWTLDATLRKLGSGYQTLLSDDSEQNQNPVSSSSYSREYSF